MKVALLCPGYGSQFVGMGKELYDEYRIVQEYFEEAANCLDVNFVKLAFASSDSELRQMNNAYTTLFVVSAALISLLQERGITFDVAAGYNIGEYAALFAARGISFPDGLYLLNKYATLYQEALSGLDVAMFRILGLTTDEVKQLCDEVSTPERMVYIALYESPTTHIIAGITSAVTQVAQSARALKAKITDVALEYGLHSDLMKTVVSSFKMYLEKVDFKDLAIPVLNNADVDEIRSGIDVRAAIISFMQRPVLWNQIMDKLDDVDLFIQVGPGTALINLINQKYPDKQTIALNTKEDLSKLEQLIKPSQTEQEASESIDTQSSEKKEDNQEV